VDICGTNNIANPYTNDVNCPAGFQTRDLALMANFPSSRCTSDIFLCLSDNNDPSRFFGGFYEIGEPAQFNRKNHLSGDTRCSDGYVSRRIARVGTQLAGDRYQGADIFICRNETIPFAESQSVIGGFYQISDGYLPQNSRTNWITRSYGCPTGYKSYKVARVFSPDDNVPATLYVCLNNVSNWKST